MPFASPTENDRGNNGISANALPLAVHRGQTATVLMLLESSAMRLVNVRCVDGQTALMHAATLGRTAIVQALLEASAGVDLLCDGGCTALMAAARHGHTSVVLALLEASASVDLQSNGYGVTALMYAAWYGHTAIVQALLRASASVDLQSNGGHTALMVAAKNGRTATVRLLLAAGADTTMRSTKGDSAETLAGDYHQAAILLLLQGKSLRTCRAFGQRALAAAAQMEQWAGTWVLATLDDGLLARAEVAIVSGGVIGHREGRGRVVGTGAFSSAVPTLPSPGDPRLRV